MTLKRYKVGIIGSGAVAELLHLPTLTKLPCVSINALVDKNCERADAMVEKFCLERQYPSYEELFDEVDIALIALPNHLHAKPTIEFLQHDVNVLCEKPMATTVSDCKAMVAAEKKSNGKLMIAHMKRFMSNILLAKKIVNEGGLGDIVEYHCTVGAKFRWPTQTGFYFKKEEAGGGVLIDMGVHVIDLFLWLFGDVTDVEYKAQDIMGKGMEDNVSLLLSHKNRIAGKLTLSRTEILDNKLVIKGTYGTVKVDIFDTTHLELDSRKTKVSSDYGQILVKTKNNNPFRDQVIHFISCIENDRKPMISGEDGMKVIEVVEKCYAQATS